MAVKQQMTALEFGEKLGEFCFCFSEDPREITKKIQDLNHFLTWDCAGMRLATTQIVMEVGSLIRNFRIHPGACNDLIRSAMNAMVEEAFAKGYLLEDREDAS